MRPRRMRDEGSVGRLLSRAFGLLIALIAGAGLLQLGAVLVQHRAVRQLAEEVQPLELANDQFGGIVSSAAWAVRSYALTGDQRMLELYGGSLNQYPHEVSRLRALATGRHEAAVSEQISKAEAWWDSADQQREAVPRSPAALAAAERGRQLFEDFSATNERLRLRVEAEGDRLQRRSETLSWITIGVIVGITVGATAIGVITALRTRRRVTDPLSELTDVLAKRADGDRRGRARVHGPAEIRAVAAALNAAADQSDVVHRHEKQVAARLQALDNAKTDFMSTVSHELRTPLTSISGYVELLRDPETGGLTPPQDRMVQVIGRNARRLRELIEDMLTLSRIETGEFRSEFDIVDLAEVVERAVGGIRPTAAKASVGLHCEVRGPLPARGDGSQLDRVLANLLSNAVKFTAPEGTVTIRAFREDAKIQLTIADTGIGIPEEEKQALFARFFRATNAIRQAIPGTGLGLAIVQTIIGNHGGTVDVDSTENVGTTVTVTLPAAAPARQEADHANAPADDEAAERRLPQTSSRSAGATGL
nr:ATP-binding protein [uncultured Actinoplanes sp.]